MVAPISQIEVFSNASVLPNGKISLGVFPVNNSAQRSATLRGENFVKITFNYGKSIPIPAFAFIEYDGQLFFTKEIYRPEPKGNNVYEYNVKFVSFDNLLSKPQAYRRVVVGSGAEQQTWNEPDIEIVGTLQTIAEVVCESIKASAVRYEGVFADMLSKVEIVSSEVSVNSESKAFSFQGQKISQVLESVANDYEIDYWFEQVGNMTNGITKMVLHFCKYERTDIDPLVLSDKTRVNRLNPYDPASPPNPLKSTVSGGLDECTFANEWSGVVQRITPFGSERNITRQQAIVDEMFVSYGKRLRLEYDHSCTIDGKTYPHAYAVKDEDGNTIPLSVDENGAVYVPGVTTGEETIEKYDDIYPRGHFRVTHVTQRGVDTQIFTVYAIPTEERNGQYVDLTDAEIDAMQADPNKRLFPIDIQDGQTLSLHFESGFLNGREFEVANKSAKMVWTGDGYKVDPDNVNAHWIACFEINPEGDNNDSPQVPYGNMVPRGKLDILGYEGDMFAIFNMDMPPYYKESAMNELAQKAYDEITAILSTRPEVKCKGNEEFFMRQNLCLGLRVKVTSDLFGEGTEFVSRVTNYSHSLSRPNSVDFRLCSSRVQGSISVLKGAIADQTQAVSGVQQTARSLSRRAFRDSQEMIGMLQSIIAEMMVVGVERNQFSFTMGIECLESAASPLTRKFSGLRITAGEIQHTQEPYIKDNWEGHYTVDATTLYVDKNNHSIGTDATEEIRNTPYYLYAVIDGSTGKANMELWAEKKDGENDDAYLLLGILSSEFLDGTTSLRVFNRSNGFTQIAGGTITTEQLQDPTRQLIIDMSSNPPRIIARNGAEIIGNIKFKASDTMTAEEQLEALGLGVNEAKGASEDAVNAAADAKQAADNAQADATRSLTKLDDMSSDSKITPQEKVSIRTEWASIQQEYEKNIAKAKELSLTYTTYTNAYNALNTYLTDTIRLSYGYTVTVTKSEFNSKFSTYYAENVNILNAIAKALAQAAADSVQVGGANLLKNSNFKTNNLDGFSIYDSTEINADKAYTLSYDTTNECLKVVTTKAYTSLNDSGYRLFFNALSRAVSTWSGIKAEENYMLSFDVWASKATDMRCYIGYGTSTTKQIGTAKTRFVAPIKHSYTGGTYQNIFFLVKDICTFYIDNVKLEKGNKATDWTPAPEDVEAEISALDYLKSALTDGSTEIAGGLTMTNVLMLKNLQGAVTAGMSGLTKLPSDSSKSENVLMWGGGTYEDAYNAAESADYYKKGSTTPITTLLKKDGTGKIGIFYIDSDTVKIKTADNTTVITNKNIINSGVSLQSSYSYYVSDSKSIDGQVSKNVTYTELAKKTITVSNGKHNIIIPKIIVSASVTATSYTEASVETSGDKDPGYASAYVSGGLKLVISNNGSVIYESSSKSISNLEVTNDVGGTTQTNDAEITFEAINRIVQLTGGSLTISLIGSIDLGITANKETPSDWGSDAGAYIGIEQSETTIVRGIDKYTVIAKDGIAIIANSDSSFYVKNDSSSQLQIIAKGLPTNVNDVITGQLYNSNGYLRIR